MKKVSMVAVIGIALVQTAYCQKLKSAQVPEQVKASLAKTYPSASKITWEKEKSNFEANWGGKSGEDMSVQFSPEGKFIEQVEAIPVSSLPSPIAAYVKTNYKSAKITEAGKVTDAKGAHMFEAEVKGKDLIFDEKGNYLKKD